MASVSLSFRRHRRIPPPAWNATLAWNTTRGALTGSPAGPGQPCRGRSRVCVCDVSALTGVGGSGLAGPDGGSGLRPGRRGVYTATVGVPPPHPVFWRPDRCPGAEGLGAKSKEMDWPSAVGGADGDGWGGPGAISQQPWPAGPPAVPTRQDAANRRTKVEEVTSEVLAGPRSALAATN